MTVPLTPASAVLPATVSVPAPGEAVNSAGIQAYVQTIVNAISYATNIALKFVNGGVISTTANLVLNALVLPYAAGDPILVGVDGLVSGGRVRSSKSVVRGAVTTGVFFYDCASVDHVFTAGPVTGAPVWQIGATTPANPETIRFVNFDTNPVVVKDPGGGVLITIKYVSTFAYAVTFAYLSGTWTLIDEDIHP